MEIDEDDNEISFDTDWRSNRVTVVARIPLHADIDVSFVTIDDANASSFELVNGNLNLRLPAKAGARIHLDTSQGEIISGVEVRIESVIVATINGGGPTVRMNTMSGDIQILKAQ